MAAKSVLVAALWATIVVADLNVSIPVGTVETERGSTLSVVEVSENEFLVDFDLAEPDYATPTLRGGFYSDSWVLFDFEFVKPLGRGAWGVAAFDPFLTPANFLEPGLFDFFGAPHVIRPTSAQNRSLNDFTYRIEELGLCSRSMLDECRVTATEQLRMKFIEIPTPIPGDANLDGTVSFADFLILSKFYTGEDIFTPGGGWFQGDFSGEGAVTLNDFLFLADHFGESVSTTEGVAAVPEPGGFVMFLFGFCLLQFRVTSTSKISSY